MTRDLRDLLRGLLWQFFSDEEDFWTEVELNVSAFTSLGLNAPYRQVWQFISVRVHDSEMCMNSFGIPASFFLMP